MKVFGAKKKSMVEVDMRIVIKNFIVYDFYIEYLGLIWERRG
jgi:hypothetical protein